MGEVRTWTDATEKFSIRGRLFQTGDYAVRILKTDGRTVAVPIAKLSDADRQFLESRTRQVAHNKRLDDVAGLDLLTGQADTTAIDESSLLGRLRVSSELMNKLFTASFTRTQPVSETIVGTPVRGVSHTVGNASIAFSPSDDRALILVPIHGVVTSRTTGYAGPVNVHGTGHSPFASSIRVELDQRGVRVLPGTTQATTNSTVTGISANVGPFFSGLVTRAAERRVAASRAQANWEAARIVERQINSTISQEIDQAM
ncbi:MAG: hypothetical protein KDA42_12600, partial [Planctomycetales bacterium]|nr:hypothetical protein [Planctomycetales bacterium]